jgi:hypothetical protein
MGDLYAGHRARMQLEAAQMRPGAQQDQAIELLSDGGDGDVSGRDDY